MGKDNSPEQIVRKLRQTEGKLAIGATNPGGLLRAEHKRGHVSPLEESLRRDEFTREAKRLKDLEKENARLARYAGPSPATHTCVRPCKGHLPERFSKPARSTLWLPP